MKILSGVRQPPETILGIDVSTNSLAYCLLKNGSVVKYGEVKFPGASMFERLSVVSDAISAEGLDQETFDLLAIEPIIYVNNRATVISLAYIMGAVVSSLRYNKISEYGPLVWQRHIGNPPLTADEKSDIASKYPGKSKSWYSNHGRGLRKKRTISWVEKEYGIKLKSDDIADAFGVARKAYDSNG